MKKRRDLLNTWVYRVELIVLFTIFSFPFHWSWSIPTPSLYSFPTGASQPAYMSAFVVPLWRPHIRTIRREPSLVWETVLRHVLTPRSNCYSAHSYRRFQFFLVNLEAVFISTYCNVDSFSNTCGIIRIETIGGYVSRSSMDVKMPGREVPEWVLLWEPHFVVLHARIHGWIRGVLHHENDRLIQRFHGCSYWPSWRPISNYVPLQWKLHL